MRDLLHPRICQECATEYQPRQAETKYCSKACKEKAHRREVRHGRLIAPAAKAWRRDRKLIKDLDQITQQCMEEEKPIRAAVKAAETALRKRLKQEGK